MYYLTHRARSIAKLRLICICRRLKKIYISTLISHWLGRRERFRGTFEIVVAETAPKPCIGL